jgi:hypothetical protein
MKSIISAPVPTAVPLKERNCVVEKKKKHRVGKTTQNHEEADMGLMFAMDL